MRPTERTRTPTLAAHATIARPAERMAFSRRDLLLTSWGDRAKMTPGEQVRFGFGRFMLQSELMNAGKSITIEIGKEAEIAKAEEEGQPTPVFDAVVRRRPRRGVSISGPR